MSGGALAGMRIVEMAGIGPGPFCGMMLADHGAEVIRVERPGTVPGCGEPMLRSRRSVALDLKSDGGRTALLALVRSADGLFEGYRPGVMERLGFGPDVLLAENPRLVYGRMTGWGQTGPYAQVAGHDINYIALSGVLSILGRPGTPPAPPINLLGDFGGGGMMLAFAMVAALLAVQRGQAGQVIDCAMTDGSLTLSTMLWGYRASGRWKDERGANHLDGGAHFYDSYECADGQYIAIGAIEPQFYSLLLERLGLADDADLANQQNRNAWPAMKTRIAQRVREKTRAQWCEILEYSDACFAPVLSFDEAAAHPQVRAREALIEVDGLIQPAPSPRLSVSGTVAPRAYAAPGADTETVLSELGFDDDQIRYATTGKMP